MRHPWRDYNGPGKPITEKQVIKLLAECGIEPIKMEDGQLVYTRGQFEQAWRRLNNEE
jgi:hypothetical protein